jgi:hypothetical protein
MQIRRFERPKGCEKLLAAADPSGFTLQTTRRIKKFHAKLAKNAQNQADRCVVPNEAFADFASFA